jgi:hypothetical protein
MELDSLEFRSKIVMCVDKSPKNVKDISDITDNLLKLFKEQCAIYIVRLSLPSHIDAGKEAKKYANKMNGKGKPNGFHELDFYNGTVWLRTEIEGNEA